VKPWGLQIGASCVGLPRKRCPRIDRVRTAGDPGLADTFKVPARSHIVAEEQIREVAGPVRPAWWEGTEWGEGRQCDVSLMCPLLRETSKSRYAVHSNVEKAESLARA
jgi:hypothetical protein